MHLMGMGFKYVSLKGLKTKYVNAPKTEFDPLTNILTDYFTESYNRFNPTAESGEAEKVLAQIQSSLMNDDLGRQFYQEILLNTGKKIMICQSATGSTEVSKQCPFLWVLQGKRLVTNFAPTTSEKTLVCGRICGACNHKKKC